MNEQVTHNLDILQALVHNSVKSNDAIRLTAARIKIAQDHIRLYSRYNKKYAQSIQDRLNQITAGEE